MEKQSPEIQMETLSVVIESFNASSSYYESTELALGEKSDDKEAHEEKACEISESRKLAHGKGRVVEEAREEDDYATPVSHETQDLDPTWMTSIEKKLLVQPKIIKVSASNIPTSIYRVPHFLFQLDNNAYVPQVVSIGPLHYDKRGGQLQAVEEHKWRILNEIVSREGEGWLEQCMVAVKELEEEARECFSQVIDLDSYSFVEMMVLDGCFIVELFRKNWFHELEDDPIFKLGWLRNKLMIDLVKLENQIPFFVLQALFDLIDTSCPSLEAAALRFFVRWQFFHSILPNLQRNGIPSNLDIHHLLHLLHENIVPSTEKKYPQAKAPDSIQNASKLQELGIKFKKRDDKNGARNFLDIKLDKGIIEIPFILLEDKTNALFRNLIAFEQCYLHCEKYITSYTYFMDCLIDSSKDVEILRQKGIIKTSSGSNEDVALLFNNIHKEVILYTKSFYLLGICEEINDYCGTAWPRLRATLMRDYFKNPWAVMSFVGAVLLLLLTMTQAFFSVSPKFAIGN